MNDAVKTMLELCATASERDLNGEEVATMNKILELSAGLEKILGVRYESLGPQTVVLRLEVDERHLQPWGITNGGIYATLGETSASMASYIAAGAKPIVMGTNNNTDFLRPSRKGDTILSTATPEHLGGTAHLWRIEHRRESDDKLLALTNLKTTVLRG